MRSAYTVSEAYTLNIVRQAGQGGSAEAEKRDLRAELLKAEAAHFAKRNGAQGRATEEAEDHSSVEKRQLDQTEVGDEEDDEAPEVKRRRLILEDAKDIDADSDGGDSDESESSEEE